MGNERPPGGLAGRGGGWVVAQGLLLVGIGAVGVLAPGWPSGGGPARGVLGAGLAVGGALLAAAGVRHLGPSLTPFPMPAEGAELRDGGVYALARHPIYGGILLTALGWSVLMSPWALAPTALLAALFEGKRRREESWLVERYPDYATYRSQVPRRFVPFVI
jgi:protein-S-isoprenylcysteine O-methyltransferase Ste14